MKRILVMSFGSDAGGIEKSLIEFLKFLIKEGYEVDLYLWRKPGILFGLIPTKVNVLNYKLNPGSLKNCRSIRDIIWYIQLRLAKLKKNPITCFREFPWGPYDVAISYCQNGYSPRYIIDKVKADKKILFYHHGSYDQTGREKELDARYYLSYDKFVTVSESNILMLESNFPNLKGRIEVVNNLVDIDGIKVLSKEPLFLTDNVKYRFCTVGRISPEKGQILAIETAKILHERGLDFVWYFVGDGSDRFKCESLVKEYNLQDICIFVGMKSNPYPYIRICDYYVQPSNVEADPVTIREAKVLRKPIIATDIPAFKEALDFGKYGIICEKNAESIADGIVNAVNGNCPKSYSDSPLNSDAENSLRQMIETI